MFGVVTKLHEVAWTLTNSHLKNSEKRREKKREEPVYFDAPQAFQ
jgi:hypothetical protein